MAEDDASADPVGFDPAEEQFPLVIAVTPSAAERIRLAEHLDGIGPLLLVSGLDDLRRLIAAPERAPRATPAPQPAATAEASHPALAIDSARLTVRCRDQEVDLTRLEHDLLICLSTEPLRVWSYAELHRAVWHDEGRQRRADVQSLVKRLRHKLNNLGAGVTIEAVRGVGLRMTGHRHPAPGG
ncbi:winged helix-turn-helix domain-containing protein [Micromonospora sp. WMMD812]|uniref:winged helix-turn-helix domain-containing protein n=1 Tax=Micromonospora sp. WMMD812 TaxID=3015152 RepID=UPI00248AD684|nr:winged helix-turn-helix domain-containing protein [Micromonospora sp. WMMD812]WBB68529.1 winged helix-turn-helix domain-containing protein [Micromonospora sp. WMMD812]